MKNKLYIAYGSNLNLPQMAQRCPTAKVVGASEIKDYALVFRGGRHGAVATIEPCEGSSVPVLLWKITPKDEAALDIYEGFPRFYDKETIDLPMYGKTVSAMVYVMTPGHRLGYPSDYYYNTIRDGYKTAGFDTAVLEQAVDYTEQLMECEPEPEQQNLFGFGGLKWW
ncbi:gamma-glutamylcyclotransferase family protein [Lacrimispora defluvii]|uniref:Gamma-glutamylcyclotransferase n=1 Tax=Lacrimispora defluvii TaxID=2719233 RepID=A0ABX1W073_9FIRM|nr:gamma-glutamylcyclotransferase family protein [Lacrimispora defluvii]NNJ32871.1 gamma-glutamylcyclotransferase [Lacrimispora defluvii]